MFISDNSECFTVREDGTAHPPNGCFCRLMEQMQPAPPAEIFYRQRRSDSRARCAPRETGMGKQGTRGRKTVLKVRVRPHTHPL